MAGTTMIRDRIYLIVQAEQLKTFTAKAQRNHKKRAAKTHRVAALSDFDLCKPAAAACSFCLAWRPFALPLRLCGEAVF
jgi:hypothetical protein